MTMMPCWVKTLENFYACFSDTQEDDKKEGGKRRNK